MNAVTISNWLPVQATLLEWKRLSKAMRRLEISREFDRDSGAQYGEALWGTPFHGSLIGLAWKWREVASNVVAIENPMAISSNVMLLNEKGETLSDTHRILQLNNAVYRLAWQAHVAGSTKPMRSRLAA